jgi:hypothetical protein
MLQQLHDGALTGPLRGMLTGHEHTGAVVGQSAILPSEVRCGTTTQGRRLGRRPGWELRVHQFDDAPDGSLEWRMTTWVFNGSEFRPTRPQVIP